MNATAGARLVFISSASGPPRVITFVSLEIQRVKKCSWCGRENAESADQCAECGTTWISTSEVPMGKPIIEHIAFHVVWAIALMLLSSWAFSLTRPEAPPPGSGPEGPAVHVWWRFVLVGVALGCGLVWLLSHLKRRANFAAERRAVGDPCLQIRALVGRRHRSPRR